MQESGFFCMSVGGMGLRCIVNMLSIMFEFKEDEDSHLTALQIIKDLMKKSPESFLDNFAQLGIFSKVMNLGGSPSDNEEERTVVKQSKVSFPH